MRKFLFILAIAGMAGIAHAEDVNFYDLLKDPVHARSWKAMLSSAKGTPAWVRDQNRFIAEPVKTISIDSVDYSISILAKQHATNDGQAAILFNADGTQAWAEIQDEKSPKLYLGNPSAAQKTALDKALAE
ncbi:Ivy family c-type lysozyme inhibitor [Rhizobium multihospitium]|uniref:Inhibitor of vertebrate lysozyme (Ivy) n=1 Tax=Rhizobium multihospitium TaxID=410764 RepID=A0A1C3W2W8_9HYPH|nr:Ivy family c-type lysozyme inhibitor [Rhizobium multihospitium]SCB34248.1 Inhibitor of vertebrate lysozyme (Ivy) [Rhizobium multihospitium]